ncbi:MAG TPA: Gfo/Idh/MocA family oxidoreductase [Dehalococcoidia bacterium]|jgi:myo-inositol 2-dehydrogenase/D-chiro-inositol 1-dehydrogenase|nr:Gfo/Idh/MocA family oxidoreductase [Dehalococcoidia bacterium]
MGARLRMGVIGAGLMGRLHAENIGFRVDGAELVAVCDINRAAAEACASSFGVDVAYLDYSELLSNSRVDAVVVCTPPNTHGEIVAAAARAGKHIFCEKPLDCALPAIDRALDAVAKAGVKLQIGFNRRFDRAFHNAQREVSAGAIGTRLTLHITSRDPVRTAGEAPSFKPEMFLDTTIHDFDMARFVMGEEIVSVFSLATERGESAESSETAITVVRFDSGAVGVIDNSWLSTYGYDQRLEVFGTAGVVSVQNEDAHPTGTEGAPFFVQRYFDSYLAEMAAFADCIVHDTEPAVTGADGRAAVALALAAQRSLKEWRQVKEIG